MEDWGSVLRRVGDRNWQPFRDLSEPYSMGIWYPLEWEYLSPYTADHSCSWQPKTCRNLVTISSGLCRLFAALILRFPKHNGGPFHWGRINPVDRRQMTSKRERPGGCQNGKIAKCRTSRPTAAVSPERRGAWRARRCAEPDPRHERRRCRTAKVRMQLGWPATNNSGRNCRSPRRGAILHPKKP